MPKRARANACPVSRSRIPAALKRLAASRADYLCEYCLIHESDTYLGCQVDHIISEKHAGLTVESNLAYACAFCNCHKGSDLGSIILTTGEFVRFYNPRLDLWAEHFRLGEDGITIVPISEIGSATERIFGFNTPERLKERFELRIAGHFPSDEAKRRITQ